MLVIILLVVQHSMKAPFSMHSNLWMDQALHTVQDSVHVVQDGVHSMQESLQARNIPINISSIAAKQMAGV